MNLEERETQQHGCCNTIMIVGGGKRLSIIIVCRTVHTNSDSTKSCKAPHNQNCGKAKRAKYIRAKMLQELKEEMRKAQATDLNVV